MLATTLIVTGLSFFVMLAAYYLNRVRAFHMPVMVVTIAFDMLFPVYLVMTKDWYRRLIEEEEIFSFMIWMHFMLVLTLYALYILQIMTVRKLIKGDQTARHEHKVQGKGILVARGLVIISAIMLIEPGQ